MHAHQLVELAATLATKSPSIFYGKRIISDRSLESYWVANRCRLQQWLIDLKSLEFDLRNFPNRRVQLWKDLTEVIVDVLYSEVLSRVWNAILEGMDEIRSTSDGKCIAQNVGSGQLEARNRVLRLMTLTGSIACPETLLLNQHRIRAERWTDLLIAFVSQHANVSHWAYDKDRLAGFSADLEKDDQSSGGYLYGAMTIASIKMLLNSPNMPVCSNYQDYHKSVAATVLDSFESTGFRETGILRPNWQARIALFTDDTDRAIDTILHNQDRNLSAFEQKNTRF